MIKAYAADLRRYTSARNRMTPLLAVKLILEYHGLQALLGYRLGNALQRAWRHHWYWLPLLPAGWLLYFLISRYVWFAFDIRLKLSAAIGAGLYIGHFGNILLERCRVGANCSISQSVHIHPDLESNAGPVVGDRVWMGAHAQVVGAYQIGAGSTISAGAVVKRDIPEQTLCLGNPARVVMRGYDNSAILRVEE